MRWGTRLGCLEMLLGGTTTFTDMYYFEDVVAEAAKEAGMRGVLGETIIGFPVADAKTPADALRFTETLPAALPQRSADRSPAVAPHALYTNSDETLKAARALANRYDAPLVIHLSETKKENDDELAKRHKTPDQGARRAGRVQRPHGGGALRLGERRRHGDPEGARRGRGALPFEQHEAGQRRGAGGAHAGARASRWGSAPTVRPAATTISTCSRRWTWPPSCKRSPPAIRRRCPPPPALEMATIRGARALGMEKEIGSLETGKRADLITVRLDRPNAVPLYDVDLADGLRAQGRRRRDVMVNGKPVVRDAKILTLNEAQILAKAAEYRAKVSASLK